MNYNKYSVSLNITTNRIEKKILVVNTLNSLNDNYEFNISSNPQISSIGTLPKVRVKILTIILDENQKFSHTPLLLMNGESGEFININLNKPYTLMSIIVPMWPTISLEGDFTLHENIMYLLNNNLYITNENGKGTLLSDVNYVWNTFYGDLKKINTPSDLISNRNDYTYNSVVIYENDCDALYVQNFYKTDCHKYTIKEDTLVLRKLTITDNSGELIFETEIPATAITYDIETSKDGIYLVKIEDIGNSTTLLEFPIYDVCNAEACYLKLVNSLQCCDVSDCNDEGKELAEKMREALNRLSGLMYFINKFLRIETDLYLGIDNIDSTRQDYIDQVDSLMEKLAVTVEKCESCFGEEITNTGCESCK